MHAAAVPQFPGRVIAPGSDQKPAILAIQQRLNDLGCGPVTVDGRFGPETVEAVELFQSRFPDPTGHPLDIDGRVGPNTWGALFGATAVPAQTTADSDLLVKVIAVADSQVGVMEVPPGSNRGPQVDGYLRLVGVDPASASPWCAAFVYFCFDEACKRTVPPRSNPLTKTAGVMEHWRAAANNPNATRISAQEAQDNPSLVKPGMIFVISTGGGHGHTGLVTEVHGGSLTTTEGNTNTGGSREGIGVFRRTARSILNVNLGYILYA